MNDSKEYVKPSLLGMTLDEINQMLTNLSLPKYTGSQIVNWLYKTQITSFDEMSNVSKQTRSILSENFELGVNKPIKEQISLDGTIKYLYPVKGDRFIETAYIPEPSRATLCVSSQVGCKMGCKFCATGKQGFQSQLTAGHIINQLRSLPKFNQVTNIVFMGMGEPFDNTDNVMQALEILTAPYGYNISSRKVTVSTVGIIPGMQRFLQQSKCNLAISLHSPFDEERQQLMPIQKIYTAKDIIQIVNENDLGKYRRVSIEYIVFGGLNDTPRHVKELARMLNKIKCRINLIRFHAVPDVPLPATNEQRLIEFQKALMNKGIVTTIRTSRGLDIDAACGLLSTKYMLK